LPPPDPTPVPGKEFVYFDNPRCAGYGPVNYWRDIAPQEAAQRVAAAGLDMYHIELLGWAETHSSASVAVSAYRELLKECRKHKIVLFTSIWNNNSHLSKYGNTPWTPSMAELNECLEAIIAEGPEGQIVQPVGETQTSQGKQFESAAWSRLSQAHIRTCYNRGSRPANPPAGWDYAAFHPVSMGQTIPAGAVCVTDTGAILRGRGRAAGWPRELGGYEKFNPETVRLYANQCLNGWKRPLILYGFLHKGLDVEAMTVLGKVKERQ